MPPSRINGTVAMCCAKGAGFVLCASGREAPTEQVVSASLAARVAQHTMEWLLDHGIENTGFCIRAAVPLGNGRCSRDEVAVETDLKAIVLNDEACRGLAYYVEPRVRPPRQSSHPIRWSWIRA